MTMPPELAQFLTPMGGGGVAGAVAYAIVKIVELKTGLPKLQAEFDAVKQLHVACEANVRALQAQIAQLITQLGDGHGKA